MEKNADIVDEVKRIAIDDIQNEIECKLLKDAELWIFSDKKHLYRDTSRCPHYCDDCQEFERTLCEYCGLFSIATNSRHQNDDTIATSLCDNSNSNVENVIPPIDDDGDDDPPVESVSILVEPIATTNNIDESEHRYLCEDCGWHSKKQKVTKSQETSDQNATIDDKHSEYLKICEDIIDESCEKLINDSRDIVRRDINKILEKKCIIDAFDHWWYNQPIETNNVIIDPAHRLKSYDMYYTHVKKMLLGIDNPHRSRVLTSQLRVSLSCGIADKKFYELKYSNIHGVGLFARQTIQPNTFLLHYEGELIKKREADRRENEYEKNGKLCYLFGLSRSWVIDATIKGNYARFINHSCEVSTHISIYPSVLVLDNYISIYFFKLAKLHSLHVWLRQTGGNLCN